MPTDASAHSRPVFRPDQTTIDDIKTLYSAVDVFLQKRAPDGHPVNVASLPFSADLLLLVKGENGGVISVDAVATGMTRIATHFISRHEIIQSRVNSYIRCKLAAAELAACGAVMSQDVELVERDQILLNSATVPSSIAPSSPHGTGLGAPLCRMDSGRDSTKSSQPLKKTNLPDRTPPTPLLFRSQSVTQHQLVSDAKNVFEYDDVTLRTVLGVFPTQFGDRDTIAAVDFSEADRNMLQELWEFFDFDEDGKVSRNDLLEGFVNIAKHFLEHDEFTQLLTNSYIQRKIRRALYYIESYTDSKVTRAGKEQKHSSGNEEVRRHADGSLAIFTDEEGNRHVARVIRRSQRPMAGHVAYYIKTKGIKLYVSERRLSHLRQEDADMVAQEQHQIESTPEGSPANSKKFFDFGKPTKPQDYHVIYQLSRIDPSDLSGDDYSSHSAANRPQSVLGLLGDDRNDNSGGGNSELDCPAPSNNSTTSGKGIFGYLRSSIAAVSKGGLGIKVSPAEPKSIQRKASSRDRGGAVVPVGKDEETSCEVLNSSRSNLPRSPIAHQSGLLQAPAAAINSKAKVEGQGQAASASAVSLSPAGSSGVASDGGPESVSRTEVEVEADPSSVVNTAQQATPASVHTQNELSIKMTAATAMVTAAAASVACLSDTVRTEAAEVEVMEVVADSNNISQQATQEQEQHGSNSEAAAQEQRLCAAVLMLAADAKVLSAVRRLTGASMRLTRQLVPKPKKVEAYPIYFNRSDNILQFMYSLNAFLTMLALSPCFCFL